MRRTTHVNRRNVIRGVIGGTAVVVGLPFLDCFLDANGTAQANGASLPVVFGNWTQGLGFNPGFWEPKSVGSNYENNVQFKALDPLKHKVTIFSGLRAYTDGHALRPHQSGPEICLSGGIAPQNEAFPTIDTLIADVVGTKTRFRTLEVRGDGQPQGLGRRSTSSAEPAEVSPAALYTRIFGAEFKDPNSAEFTPDSTILARQSVLSAITERRAALATRLGAADKIRLDEYFTSLRELENQLSLSLQKPEPMVACTIPDKVEETEHGTDIAFARINHRLFARLLAHAVACGQTQVINVALSGGGGGSQLRRPGSSMTFHVFTHEEAVDPALGYQPNVGWFQDQVINSFVEFLTIFDNFKEGPNTLLDRSLIMYSTDVGLAKTHSQDNIPMMLAGGAGGRAKTGMHIPAAGQTVARVGLTVQQIMGVPTSTWGTESNKASKPFTEIMT